MNRRELLAGATGILAVGGLSTVHASSKAPLITRAIPSSGEALPVIGLGTSGPFEVGSDAAARAPLREVLDAFFGAGATVIDTSPMYSTAEGVLGDLLTPAQQKQCFMATKVWTDGASEGASQMAASERLLRHKPLDLIQVHNLRDLDTHLATLREWKAAKRVRYIGITHYTVASQASLAEVIRREKLDFVQLNYSVATRDAETTLLPLARDRGVAVLVNRAFEDGKLFANVKGKPVPAWAAEFEATSWAQVFLKYVIANEAVTCVIPATGKPKNMLDNLDGGRGRLPDAAQRAKIVAAVTG
jgi:diketogulonate reductase-like aldo/keto reductase